MATITDTSRTTHLLALMKEGDDAFNDRDFKVLNMIHHPDIRTPRMRCRRRCWRPGRA
jgi:hypothetical protein